ncbi:MAG: hypothetical protein ACLQDQ_10355 [Myxococcaceae bacterium]
MTRRPGTTDKIFGRADAPTLALSTVRLDVDQLRQLLVFERTLRRLAPPGCSAEQMAQAHSAAVGKSGIAPSEVEAPLALLRRFAANRTLSASLKERLDRLSVRAPHDLVAGGQAAELRRRLIALDEALHTREDAATCRVLENHTAEILALFAASSTGD